MIQGAWLLVACLCAPAAITASPAPESAKLRTDIAPQSLAAALAKLQQQTGLQYFSDRVGAQRTKGARAGDSALSALSDLLECTGLKFEQLNARSVRIYAPDGPQPVDPRCESQPSISADAQIAEVTITGRRRAELADKVPISIAVWTPEEIEASGIKSMLEVGALTPGVEYDFLSSVGSGVYTNLAVRGVADRHGTVTGVFLDDIELPTVRSNTSGRALPSYFDLERIEVLRGPQGTLLGPDTQSGAVRFIPAAPSLTESTYSGHAEWAATERGAPTYEIGAVAGGPFVDNALGYRISAWYRSDGGYVDRVDPFTGAIVDANADRTVSENARGAVTLTLPDSGLSVTPMIDYQSTYARDSRSFFTYLSDPGAGELYNGSLIRQPANDAFYLTTLKAHVDLGPSKLSALTAYFDRTGSLIVDDTESKKWGAPEPPGTPDIGWGNPLGAAYPVAYSNAVTTGIDLSQQLFSQQVQLESRDSNTPFSWLAAAVYSRLHYREADRVTGQSIPLLYNNPLDLTYTTSTAQTQFAGFGTLTRAVTQRLKLTAGLRVERDEYNSAVISAAPPGFVAIPAAPSSSRDGATLVIPMAALSYQPDERSLYYLSATKGYSPPGADAALSTCFLGLTVYPADTLWSYELGGKVALLGGRARLEASAFHTHWDNGPTPIGNCLFNHMPGRAVSNGFDFALQITLVESVKTGLALSYTDARYTQTIQADGAVIVRSGDAVGTPPLVTSPLNLTTWIERPIPVRDGLVSLRAEDVFHSRNPGPFYTEIPGPYYAPGLVADPATNVVNVRARLTRLAVDFALFVDNVFDTQPTLLQRNKGNDLSSLYYATTFKPRTVGLAVTWRP